MSKTPDWILAKIRAARDQQLTVLDLRMSGLTHIPSEVFDLIHLTQLDLSNNQLRYLPEAIERLTHLTQLDLGNNQLRYLPEAIERLTHLTRLDLSENQLGRFPETIDQLTSLETLCLWSNQLTELPEAIGQLINLTTLYLSRNQLTELPEAIGQLINLQYLYLSENQLGELPETIGYLPDLLTLNLSFNRLSELPKAVTRLPNLEQLYLGDNPIEFPPPEILDLQGRLGKANLDRIRNYFDQLAHAQTIDRLYEAKLLIVGEGGAGKTTLANKIIDPKYQLCSDQATTEGIEVLRWSFKMEDGQTFYVNIWDFGGQEIYHTTHQFFLTKRSLYALVADTRQEDTDFFYWLNVVELLSDKSPLLIVKNEKQDRHREINDRQLRGRFVSLKDSLATNLANNRGLDKVICQIKNLMLSLPIVGVPLPKTWVQVRIALEADPRNHIRCDEFRQICRDNGFSREEDIMTLSSYLHDLGVHLHFQDDPVLRNIVILKPEWGTDAVYKVLDNLDVIRNLGRFTWDDLDSIWHEPKYAGMQNALLKLMLKFKLCYRLPNTENTFIAPQLLTVNQPNYVWDEVANLQLRFSYDFMPKGILIRFIVDMHQDIAKDQNGGQLVWKTGVILEYENTQAEVIEDYDRRMIYVRIAGYRKRDLMTTVKRSLETIHQSFHNLRYHVLIPCNCNLCSTGKNEPHFFKLETLERAIDAGAQPTCDQSFERIDPRTLILDVFEYSHPLELDRSQKQIHVHVEGNVGRDIKISGNDLTETYQGTGKDEDQLS